MQVCHAIESSCADINNVCVPGLMGAVLQTTLVQGPVSGELLIQCHSFTAMSGLFSVTAW